MVYLIYYLKIWSLLNIVTSIELEAMIIEKV